MTKIHHLKFGQPCFTCGDIVPTERVVWLRSRAEREGQALKKSDIFCDAHQPPASGATVVRR